MHLSSLVCGLARPAVVRVLFGCVAAAAVSCRAENVAEVGATTAAVRTRLECPTDLLLERLQSNAPDDWLAADLWMGALPSQMTNAGGALLVTTTIPKDHHLRVERNLLCGDKLNELAGRPLSADARNVRNVHIALKANSSSTLVFRLWDRDGGWLEWPLAQEGPPLPESYQYDLHVPDSGGQLINLEKVGGFMIEVRNGSAAAIDANFQLTELTFGTAAPEGSSPISPSNSALPQVAVASVARPATGLHDYIGTPIHTVFNADTVDRFFQFNSPCESSTIVDSSEQDCTDSLRGTVANAAEFRAACMGPSADPTACDEEAAKQAISVLTSVVNRACGSSVNAQATSYADCGLEFMFGPDGVPISEALGSRLAKRLELVAQFCDAHAIPFYIHVAAPNGFAVTNPNWLGTSLDHAHARGLWVAETAATAVEYGDDGLLVPGGLNQTAALAKLLVFVKQKGKVVGWHRTGSSWWGSNLHFELVDAAVPERLVGGETVFHPGIFSAANRDVLVPVAENVEQPAAQALNAATVLGFQAAGRSKAIGASVQSWPSDNMRWATTVDMPEHNWLRMFVAAVATGATYIQIEPTWAFGSNCLLSDETGLNGLSSNCSPAVRNNLTALNAFRGLVNSGVVVPSRRFQDLASVPKVLLQAKYDFTFGNAEKAHFNESGDTEVSLLNCPRENNFARSIQKPNTDLFARLYGSSHFYEEVFTRLPYGLVAMLAPPAASGNWGRSPTGFRTIVTDGVESEEPGLPRFTTPHAALEHIAQAYSAAAAELPITADAGMVSAIRAGADRYLVYLIDAEERFPVGASGTLMLKLAGQWRATDAISGGTLAAAPAGPGRQAFSYSVPAGGFSLVYLNRIVESGEQAAKRESLAAVGLGTGVNARAVIVARSLGDGQFSVEARPGAENFVGFSQVSGTRVLQGDFDGDSFTDFAMLGQPDWQAMPAAFSRPSNGSFFETNEGHQVFQALANQSNVSAIVGQFNTDSRSDILLLGNSAWLDLPLALSNGNGSFVDHGTTTQTSPSGILSLFAGWSYITKTAQLAGDFNGDGRTDVALTGADGWQQIAVAFANGSGSFGITNAGIESFQHWSANEDTKRLVGDFNGDGKSDLTLVGSPGFQNMPVAFSNGDGTFRVTNALSGTFQARAGMPGTQLLIGDFDADGKSDILAAGGGGPLSVAFSNGDDGTFRFENDAQPLFTSWLGVPNAVARAGDFDGDGRTDVAITGPADWSAIPIAFSNSDGTFNVTNGGSGEFQARSGAPRAFTAVGRF